MTIQDILAAKGNRIITISPHHTLHLALCTMIENKIGALPVEDTDGTLLGIITERDLMREVYKNTQLHQKLVKETMTRKPIIATPDQDIEYVMAEMTQGRFRHMPVLREGELIGIISIGDIVKSKLNHVQEEVAQYKDFVTLDWRAS